MGFHVAYLLVRGKSPQEIQKSLNLEGTGEILDFPDGHIIGARLPSGWYLVYVEILQGRSPFRYPDEDFSDFPKNQHPKFSMEDQLREISKNAEVILGLAEECGMHSFACCWQYEHEVWRVDHFAGKYDTDHFESSGTFPPQFQKIKGEHFRRNKEPRGGGCLFEVPAELVLSITGFRYDGNNPGGHPTDQFEVLRLLPPRKPWWQFWKSS